MDKIPMHAPVVEMDGDEMTRVLWQMIKEELIAPFVELQTVYFDLGLKNRDATEDAVTVEAAYAVKKYHVGIKCATITPNADRVREYGLRRMYKSPNGTLRAILDGTVFRTPIPAPCLMPYIRTWKKPITIARHAYGDIYRAVECSAEAGDTAELVVSRQGAEFLRTPIYRFEGAGACRAPTTRTPRLKLSRIPASVSPWKKSKISGFPAKTPYPKPMTDASGISLPVSMRKNTRPSLKPKAFRISIR